ncbi:unnamed protein product [Phytomonas sp. EM1]|nr:unnamed protein product [Phytomonas sp. EM1]|eukprot:CCW64819.1 unnamed protein product [Phytomonas sp. isolate EM1]
MGTGASREHAFDPWGRPANAAVSARLVINGRPLSKAPQVRYLPSPPRSRPRGGASEGRPPSSAGRLLEAPARRRAVGEVRADGMSASSLTILDLLQDVERAPAGEGAGETTEAGLAALRRCHALLARSPPDRVDALAVAVHQKEGELLHRRGERPAAKQAYGRAITTAEGYIAQHAKECYPVLKRYVLAMMGLAKIWHEDGEVGEREREREGGHPIAACTPRRTSFHSIGVSSVGSFGGPRGVGEEMSASTTSRGSRVRIASEPQPLQPTETQLTRKEESGPQGRMARKLIALPCELLLIRCCEVVEIAHNYESELLIPPLLELARIYEDVQLYGRAKLVVQRCLGTLCCIYDYDHPWVIQLRKRVRRLEALRRKQLIHESATRIQATWKMYRAMCILEIILGHPVHRHPWIPSKFREKPDSSVIGSLVKNIPLTEGWEEGDLASWGKFSVASLEKSSTHRRLFQEALSPTQESSDPSDPDELPLETQITGPIDVDKLPPLDMSNFKHMIDTDEEGERTFFLPGVQVLSTMQKCDTDTSVEHTELGNVITVRTTTTKKMLTEKMNSDEKNGSVVEEETEEDREEEKEIIQIQGKPVRQQIRFKADGSAY